MDGAEFVEADKRPCSQTEGLKGLVSGWYGCSSTLVALEVDCGWANIDEAECVGQLCCWRPNQAPICYYHAGESTHYIAATTTQVGTTN